MTETRTPYSVAVSQDRGQKRRAKLRIREGLRLILAGIEELWGLPRSFETKRGRGKDKGGGTA